MMIVGILLAMRTLASAPGDSAYLYRDTLSVEPVGLRLTVPSFWMGRVPAGATSLNPGGGRSACQLSERSTVVERIVTRREQLVALDGYPYGSKLAPELALDSIVPAAALVAHVGGVPFETNCIAPHVRIYVVEKAAMEPVAIAVVARREIGRHYSDVASTSVDSAGWNILRLAWTDSKTDFVHPGTLEIWYRQLGSRVVILGVMDAWSGKEDTSAFLTSIRFSATRRALPNK